ncbi:glycosyltransferase family 2 protein [Campylobacter lanienae]|uniref:glycosyltransferase family 2 protein n=1 Tax=Campylobacter lanienae TaxID=75658 RepID=UPI000BB4336B|nr:glycosyltransferase family 2 protein [Campylobacter lanienae]
MQLLTIGIPVYNCEDLIRNTLQNVFEEIKNISEPVEILICNNASTDNTEKEILKAIQEIKPDVKELSEKIIIKDGNMLVYHKNTENIGMDGNVLSLFKYAGGKYVHIHSADDYYADGALKRIIECIKKYHDLSLLCLSNNYLNTFTDEIIVCGDNQDKDIYCEGINEFINNERLKMLCLSNVVINKNDVEKIEYPENGIGCSWMHLYLAQKVIKKDSKCFVFGFEKPLMIVRFGNQGWVKKDAICYFYRALDLYAGMLKKRGGVNFEYYNILKEKFLNSVLNPKTQKSDNFLTNIKYTVKFFKFYFPKLRKWYKFSSVLIFSKKKDFFSDFKKG